MKNASLHIMRELRLNGMADAYEAVCGLPINQQPEPHQLTAIIIEAEQQYRSHKRMELFLRLSKLRYQATLPDIECSPKRNLRKEQLAALADAHYIDRAENIIITGATGCGKSFLSCATVLCLNGSTESEKLN